MPPNADIRDIKPLLSAPGFSVFAWALALFVVGALLFLGALYLKYRRRRKAAASAPELPATEALRRLEALKPQGLVDREHVRRWSFAISEVLRHFVLRQFDLPATQLTTEEILLRLPGTQGFAASQSLSLRSFLAATDAMKYAGHAPNEKILLEVFERACSLVELSLPAAEAPFVADAKERA